MKVALHNLGCKVNAYETEAMTQLFKEAGYEIVAFGEMADVYIINTCSVTNIADRKSRQMLHKAKKNNPNAVVAAVGCYAQVASEALGKDEAVDIIVGNNKKNQIVAIVEEHLKDKIAKEVVIDIAKDDNYEDLRIATVTEHSRAYIKIQDGCNQFCSYCIIPYARGRIRSRAPESIYDEVRTLSEQGFKEIVLTGIHLSSYDYEGMKLIDIVEELNKMPDIERIRLGSLEPLIVTKEFAKRLSECEKMCSHFHLSMQSGCDATLKRMNRHYTSQEYYDRCEILRKYFDNPAFTTDVIVGFPGETDEEFRNTCEFVKKVGFAELHVFKYSKRSGTRAAVMENQVDEKIKSDRSDILIGIGEEGKKFYRNQYVGKNVEVLFEEETKIGDKYYYVGHTKEYIKIATKANVDLCKIVENVEVLEPLNSEIMLATL